MDADRALLVATSAVAALVLMTPLVVAMAPLPATLFPFVVAKSVYAHTLIEIAFGLAVIVAIRLPAYAAYRSWLLALLFVYLLINLVAAFLGVAPQRSLWSTYERMQGTIDLIHWATFAAVLTLVFRSESSWTRLLNFNLAVSGAVALLAVAQVMDIRVWGFEPGPGRATSTLGNATYLGAYMSVNTLLALGFLARSIFPLIQGRAARAGGEGDHGGSPLRAVQGSAEHGSGRLGRRSRGQTRVPTETLWRFFWVVVAALDFVALNLSGSRGALAGFLAGLLAVALGYLIWGRVPRLRLASIVSLGAALGLVLAVIAFRETGPYRSIASVSPAMARIAKGVDESRVSMWGTGLRAFAARPVLGWGPETFSIAHAAHVTPGDKRITLQESDQAHNKLVEELTTKGVLGLAAYLALWAYLVFVVARRVRSSDGGVQVLTLFVGAALAAYFVQNLFLFDTPGTASQLFLLIGFVAYLDTTLGREAISGSHEGDTVRLASVAAKLVRTPWVFAAANTVVIALVGLTAYYVNFGRYYAANKVVAFYDSESPWVERLEAFERSVEAFPPMANDARVHMFHLLSENWPSLTPEEAQAAVDVALREGTNALSSGSKEWRVYNALARLDQTLAVYFDQDAPLRALFTDRARTLVQEADRLAPEEVRVVQILVQQHIIEGEYDQALRVIDNFVANVPEAESQLSLYRDPIGRAGEE